MGKPTVDQFIANPSAYGFVRVTGGKLHDKDGNTKVVLTDKFSYFRVDETGDVAKTLDKVREMLGSGEVVAIINGSSSLKVKQQNKVRPMLQVSGKDGATPPALKRSDEAGITRASAEALLGATSSRTVVTVTQRVYVANDGTECDSLEQVKLLNKALAEIDEIEQVTEEA